MSVVVLLRSLADQRRALLGWGLGVVVTVGMIAAVWPSMRDMVTPEFLASYPEAIGDLFDIAAMNTGAGFLNGELFTIILPALFIAFAVARSARTLTGEERDGTLEMVLATPVSRTAVLVAKTMAMILGTVSLGLILVAAMVLSSVVFGLGIAPGDAAVGGLAMAVLGMAFGAAAMATGALTASRAAAMAIPAAVAVAGYVLHVLGALVPGMASWQPLSPFTMVLENGPIGGTPPIGLVWLTLATVVLVVVAVVAFNRRDITTP